MYDLHTAWMVMRSMDSIMMYPTGSRRKRADCKTFWNPAAL